jgi:nitroreductase
VDIYEALYTTRAMRRLTTEPVPLEIQAKILDAAIRAPSPGNSQTWRFMLVDDPEVKASLAPIYLANFTGYAGRKPDFANLKTANAQRAQQLRNSASAWYLAEHWAEVPLFLFGFVPAGQGGTSIFPALWSAQLAARAEGLGSTLTTLQTANETESQVLEILGVPAEAGLSIAAVIPIGYPAGKWGVPNRTPIQEISYRNQWGTPVGFEVSEPLWRQEE